jgi:hypothetical protein
MLSPCEQCGASTECLGWTEEYIAADGVFIKEIRLPKAGTLVPQHSHEYDHTSYLAKGSVLFEGAEIKAPKPIFIPAGKKHTFISLEDDTLILCIHNVARTGVVEVREEHTAEEALRCLSEPLSGSAHP